MSQHGVMGWCDCSVPGRDGAAGWWAGRGHRKRSSLQKYSKYLAHVDVFGSPRLAEYLLFKTFKQRQNKIHLCFSLICTRKCSVQPEEAVQLHAALQFFFFFFFSWHSSSPAGLIEIHWAEFADSLFISLPSYYPLDDRDGKLGGHTLAASQKLTGLEVIRLHSQLSQA